MKPTPLKSKSFFYQLEKKKTYQDNVQVLKNKNENISTKNTEMNYPAAELRSIKMNFYLFNPDAEHRGILLIKINQRRIKSLRLFAVGLNDMT